MSNQNYRITALSIRNYKRVTKVDIEPDSDANWILIAGNNTNGKTSILDAVDVAVGGKRVLASDPVNHGAVVEDENAQARIGVELTRLSDGSTLSIERIVEQDGSSKIKLLINGAVANSPQTALDKLIGHRFLDPLEFLTQKPPLQRARLLDLGDRDGRLAGLEIRRQNIFDKRTETGREVTRAEGELARLPQLVDVPELIDVAKLAAEREEFAKKQREGDALGVIRERRRDEYTVARATAEKHQMALDAMERSIVELRQTVEKAKAAIPAAEEAARAAEQAVVVAAQEWTATTARREQLDADLARATQDNKRATDLQHDNERRLRAQAAVDTFSTQRAKQTEALDKIEAEKQKILRESKLPVEGLDFDAEGLKLNGAPFKQASSAEQIRVAVGIAASAASHLDDIMVRNAALLDDDSMELLKAAATEHGKRLWLEIIRPTEGAIIIENGKVRS